MFASPVHVRLLFHSKRREVQIMLHLFKIYHKIHYDITYLLNCFSEKLVVFIFFIK